MEQNNGPLKGKDLIQQKFGDRLSRIEKAVENPIDGLTAIALLYQETQPIPIDGSGNKRENQYARTATRFTYEELSELSDADFLILKQSLEAHIINAYKKRGLDLPPILKQCINPKSKSNVLDHERQHLDILSDRAKKTATIDFFFATPLFNDCVILMGSAYYDRKTVTIREEALSASNPMSLNEQDKQDALSFAEKTNDPDFLEEIRVRISTRETH